MAVLLIGPLLLASAWLCLILPGPARADPPPAHFEVALAAEVFATALAFMGPRTLEPVATPQLAIWGLRGLSALDPALAAVVQGDALQLTLGERVLTARPLPAPDDLRGWANVSALLSQAAWAASAAVRRAGTTGIVQSYFDEMFNHLDPYSRYVPPGEASAERERRIGEASPGLLLGAREDSIFVQGLDPDGPAEAAGVQPGDRLLAVDGEAVAHRRLEDVARALIGPPGSTVTLTFAGRRDRRRTVSLVRALLPPQTVFAEARGGLLLLRITGFSSDTGQSLARALSLGLQDQVADPRRPRGVVFDLRGNRGGLLRQAVTVAQTVLSAGIVAVTAGRDPEAGHILRAEGQDLTGGLPVVVIVDGRTASAAEIVAAALADQRRAVVVGSATLGKGLVQTISRLPDGGELFITWSRVLAPQGWPLQGLGVLPQLCTSLGQASLERQQAALVQGRNLLAAALAQERTARAPVPLSQILAIRGACPAAEGRDEDVAAAHFLIDSPAAYQAALLPAGVN
jgi:carboxyl-terminal processing protease